MISIFVCLFSSNPFYCSAITDWGRVFAQINMFLLQVRKVDMLEGVTVVRSEKVKDELVLDGNDVELVSRSAALINQVGILLSHNILVYPKFFFFVLIID